LTFHPVHDGFCSDCGTAVEVHADENRCPACFERYLYDLDAGFLENYRRFGCRSHLVVAETCLRGLVLAAPDHRKVLAMTIFERYVAAMADLAGLFAAFQRREQAPILKSFLEFRLDALTAPAFFDAVQSASDAELCASLGLPLPAQVPYLCPHLDEQDAYSVSVAIHQLTQELRKATDQGDDAALALAQFANGASAGLIADHARWLNGEGAHITPDQVALLVLDSRRGAVQVQGLTADEGAMGRVVDAIDTATRAASNLIFAYLQTNDL
jgi:hypothetical protein